MILDIYIFFFYTARQRFFHDIRYVFFDELKFKTNIPTYRQFIIIFMNIIPFEHLLSVFTI